MKSIFKFLLFGSITCLLITLIMLIMGQGSNAGFPLMLFFFLLALAVRGTQKFKGFSFTILIFAAVTVSMYYPSYFTSIGSFNLKKLIVPLLQIIMFGMGTAMSIKDFGNVVKMPKGVLVGLTCQFTIMPLLGFSIASLFGFPAEVAAGVVLVGSSPSGLASNVMAYLAKANLALSVTLTAVSTVLAPLMTPLLMKVFAGQFVPIDFWSMMLSILKIVILPIIVGLIFNHFFHGKAKWLDKLMPIVSMVGIALIITIITAAGRDSLLTIGLLLVLAAIIHNIAGYFLGYWGSRALKMSEQDCRTIALEVGMQNGGLASGIALEMGKVATIGLAPAVFGPWMNISGSSLATWWRDKDAAKNSGSNNAEKKETADENATK
ncbi:bile acid:sodium symporter family protein [Flavivirga spongiicola]|uniref:Bile acid:sodium symporter family protein n=1 Tax=Flavivirga spongiicola TaxID=421621 RepID=A0ABU7XVH3_9FLAO|nr:bile acid:sodium symporter family protein [Flavivirga sp. MEBiC05379]MDO5979776.1 bile acid:sodium symporter family protein [Flavivirga sp. MEBiC05379]